MNRPAGSSAKQAGETAASTGEGGAARRRAGHASWFGALTMVLNAFGTVLILLIAVLVNADIVGRDLFHQPLAGVTEFVGLAIVAVVFLQLANALREDRHVANDLILHAVGASWPRVARAFYALFHLIGAVLMALIAWFVAPIFWENWEGGFYKGTAGLIEIPVWPFVLAVLIGAATTAVQYLLLSGRELRRALETGGKGGR